MELREQLHHLIEALPESALEDATKLLVALQQPATAKPPLQTSRTAQAGFSFISRPTI